MAAASSNSRAQALDAVSAGSPARRLSGKRLLDLALAVPATVMLLPLMLLLGVLVRLDSRGPALFRQQRIGRDGRPCEMWKFRSMYVGAPEARHRAVAGEWFSAGASGYRSVDDPRVTRVGRFLRSTSLDELPQLLNVLRGEMSLVGPRPAIPYELELYETWHHERQLVPPGMTGLWQVMGRDRLSAPVMMELDIRYVRERTFLLDLRILLWTLPALFGRYARG